MIERADRAWTDWLVAAAFDSRVSVNDPLTRCERHLRMADGSSGRARHLTKATRRLERDLQQALEPKSRRSNSLTRPWSRSNAARRGAGHAGRADDSFPAWHRAPSMVMAAARTDRLELAA